ncbi:hypothetical protein [Marinoscillum sp. MHG1-6]|uniref:hypothetical protein n=1 Tax=Marinoscillum sp. MHG1-6 TaxID=2959627 RepID=UPI002157AA4F|nr:hypothetical protein [Marinoscillum sp. MHG1-6]
MTKKLTLVLLFILQTTIGNVYGQLQRFPANVSPIVGLPYSLYLSDYTDPAKELLTANIIFNDYNEPSWTFRLKLRLEGADIRLETSPHFIPSQPITVSPGEPVRFTGEDWIEYLDYRNLNIDGVGRKLLLESGRLPEGGYTLYLQVLDYHTGEALSRETPISFWASLKSPPIIITPQEDAFIQPTTPQIPFTWQLFNGGSPNDLLGHEYELTIWEITEESMSLTQVDPLSAVQNGQAVQIFKSDRVASTSLVYGLADPSLEAGKAYIYQVQAFSLDGKDAFKNQGKSQFRKFYYGWPTGGDIPIKFPEEGHVLGLDQQAALQWHTPSNLLPGQSLRYEIRVAEVEDQQSPEQALEGPLWYFYETSPTTSTLDQALEVPIPKPTQKYAWEVIGYCENQEVSRSDVHTFHGPPLLERFYAGTHRVEVFTINDDENDLSGTGKVRLEPDKWTDISFEHLKLKQSGMLWTLDEGEIIINKSKTHSLKPTEEVNGDITFISSQYKLDKNGLSIFGYAEWPLHLATFSSDKSLVISKSDWFTYDEFYLSGGTHFVDGNTFELLDPFGFALDVSPTSKIYFSKGIYTLQLDGFVGLPDNIKGFPEYERVKVPFQRKEQLFYFNSDDISVLSPIYVADELNIFLETSSFTVDLSEEKSPGAFSENESWKGIAYREATLIVPTNLDPRNHIKLSEDVSFEIPQPIDGSALAYISDGGLFFSTKQTFSDNLSISFNTFPCTPSTITLEVENNELTDQSVLTGKGYIPVLSSDNTFDFSAPISKTGFTTGYFEGLEGYRFTHNPDNDEQRITGTVQRAVFEEHNRLSLTLDLKWPALNASITGLRYFKVWGNYNVGFYTPEGLFALDKQITTTHQGFPITIDAVAVGRNSGQYGFGVSGKISLGDDVAGNDGAPSFNMYSLTKNPRLPGDYIAEAKVFSQETETINFEAAKAKFEAEITAKKESAIQALDARIKTLDEGISAEVNAQAMMWEGGTTSLPEDMIDTAYSGHKNSAIWQDQETAGKVVMKMIQLHAELATNSKWNPYSKAILALTQSEKNEFLPNFRSLPDEVSTGAAAMISAKIIAPMDREIQKVTKEINTRVNSMTSDVNGEIETLINGLVDNAADEVISAMVAEYPEIGGLLAELTNSLKKELNNEITSSINESVYENITFPVTTLLQDQLLARIESSIKNSSAVSIKALFTPGEKPANALASSLKDLDEEFAEIGVDVLRLLKPDEIATRIKSLGSDAIKGVSGSRIVGRLSKKAKESVAQLALKESTKKSEEYLNKQLSEELGVDIPLDVGGSIVKLVKSGSLKKAILADPITVKLRSPAMDFNGTLYHTKDHPIYGNVFSSTVDVLVKVPDKSNPINIQGAYMNGRKNGSSYWFVEIGGNTSAVQKKSTDNFDAPQGMDQIGGEMEDGFSVPKTNINLGIMTIAALRGRVYKHMKGDGLTGLSPDPSNMFGAYLHMVMLGPKQGDLMRMEVQGEVNTSIDGNMELDFRGDIQVSNNTVQIEKADNSAAVQGSVEVKYNERERHFFGYATVQLISSGLCGEGSLLVDVKPGQWRVALGNREDRIGIVPACTGMAYYGWIDLQSEYVEVGAGLGLAFYKDVNMNLAVAKVGLIMAAAINVNAFASVNYKPLTVREIGVFVELWANIQAWYKLPLKKRRTIELVDVYLYASSIMRFYPSPSILYGTLKGRIALVKVVKFKFEKNYEVDI